MIGRYAARRFSTAAGGKNIGFIGLGKMGYPMVQNLLKHGYKVTAFDANEETLKLAEASGATIAPDAKEATIDNDIVLTMLPNTDIVEETRNNYIFENAKENALIIDSSTISPIASKKMAEEGKNFGLRVIDAPVSGGVPGAVNGTLTFMVGSKMEDFPDAEAFLSAMGANIVHCGGPGNGQIAKICNNLCLGIQMISICEGLSLGEKLGMDPKVLSQIMSTSTGSCWSLNTYNPKPGIMENVPSSNNYNGGFGVSLMKKDLSIVLDSAAQVDIDLQFGTKAIEYYHELERQGLGTKDFSVVYRYVNELKKSIDTNDSD